jgi:hypothetical protein
VQRLEAQLEKQKRQAQEEADALKAAQNKLQDEIDVLNEKGRKLVLVTRGRAAGRCTLMPSIHKG